MPPVSWKRVRRSSASTTLKRSTTPGSHHTGSTAILVTTALATSAGSMAEREASRQGLSRATSGRIGAVTGYLSGKLYQHVPGD